MSDLLYELEKARNTRKPKKEKESVIVRAILEKLRAIPGCVVFKHHGSVYSKGGHADVYGVYKGKAFFIEVKRPGERPTTLQLEFLRTVKEAGAIVGWVDRADKAVLIVTGYEKGEV